MPPKMVVASVHDLKTVSAPKNSISGVLVGGVVEGSPAAAAGIETGMTMIRINNTKMQSIASFVNFMEKTQANQTIEIELLPPANYTGKLTENGTVVFNVQLSSNPSESKHGFLGVMYGNNGIAEFPTLGISVWMPQAKLYLEALKQIPSLLTEPAGWIILFGLPIYGFAGEGFRGFSGTYHAVLSSCGLGRTFRDWDFLDCKYLALDWLAELLCRAVQLSACSTSGRRTCI